MSRPHRDGFVDYLLSLGVREGVRFGLTMAVGLSLYAAAIVALFTIVRLVTRPATFAAELPEGLRFLAWVVLAYFAAFGLAGGLLGAINRVPAGPLRYPIAGFLLGAAIYGMVGVAMKLGGLFGEDEPPPGWGFVGGMTLFMGALWGTLGAGVGVVRWWRARRRRPPAAER
jgi:hypothetical protein